MNLDPRRLPFSEEEQGATGNRFGHRLLARNRLAGSSAVLRQQRVGLTQAAEGSPPAPGVGPICCAWKLPRVEVTVASALDIAAGTSGTVAGALGAATRELRASSPTNSHRYRYLQSGLGAQ